MFESRDTLYIESRYLVCTLNRDIRPKARQGVDLWLSRLSALAAPPAPPLGARVSCAVWWVADPTLSGAGSWWLPTFSLPSTSTSAAAPSACHPRRARRTRHAQPHVDLIADATTSTTRFGGGVPGAVRISQIVDLLLSIIVDLVNSWWPAL